MDQLITRQPVLVCKSTFYIEKELFRYNKSFCYEFILSEKIIMVPNCCRDYIWNIDKKMLYCFEDITQQMEFADVGDRLFGIHLDSIYICEYDKKDLKQWMEDMGGFSGFDERFKCCNAQISTILHISQVPPFVRYAIEEMEEAGGKTPVETIAAELGYTSRHMERLFLQTFSFGPKRFCRYTRLLNVITNMVQYPEQNISYYIENLGYSDQAHFQREFKAFMGMTPRQFMKRYLDVD